MWKENLFKKKIFLFENTVFSNSKLKPKQIFELLYFFSCRRLVSDASQTIPLDKKTVKSFYDLFRASIRNFLNTHSVQFRGTEEMPIHIDETPLTRRHGGVGTSHASNTVWVFGAIQIETRKILLKFLP